MKVGREGLLAVGETPLLEPDAKELLCRIEPAANRYDVRAVHLLVRAISYSNENQLKFPIVL